MGDELYTIKNIAQRLDLPESTLRKYRDTYIDYIPFVGSGRNKQYKEEAVIVFQTIRDCREERRLSWEDTERELIEKFSLNEQAVRAEKRTVIKADDAVNLVDRLEVILKQLKSGSERQEFTMTALANELMRFSGAMDKVKAMEKDIAEFRRLIYSYNEVAQRQMKEGLNQQVEARKAAEAMRGKMRGIEEALAYFPRYIDMKFEEAAKRESERTKEIREKAKPAALELPPQTQQGADPAEMQKLREELLGARIELGKYKNLYEKVKKDIDDMKERMSQKIDDQLSEPVGERLEQMMNPPSRGGKLTVRGRKK